MRLTHTAAASSACLALGLALSAPSLAAPSDSASRTPFGTTNPSCVHHLAKGDTVKSVGGHDVVTHSSGSKTTIGQCPTAPSHSGPTSATGPKMSTRMAKPAAAAPVDGWQESDWMYGPSTSSVTYFHSLYTVPKSPVQNDGQTIYYFTSATAPNDDGTIIQPVLEYGTASDGGWSGQWSIDSWVVTDNNNFFFAGPQQVNQGDTIYGSVFSKNCTVKNGCNWTVWTHDNTTGAAATLNTTGDKRKYNAFQPGVLEAYHLQSCADFPQSAVTFSAVHFMVGSKEIKSGYTPWITDPACGMSVTDNPSKYSTTMHVNGH